MSIAPQARQQADIPEPVRKDTVVMGRQGFFSVLLRLIGVELYKLRRRRMSRVMTIIAILSVIIAFVLIGLSAALVNATPPSSYASSGVTPAEAIQAKQADLMSVAEPLHLPYALFTTSQIVSTVGLALIIILAGTIVGGEYGVGTIRLMFTRGPTRTQFILAKLGATLFCALLGTVVLVALGLILGAILMLIVGIPYTMEFFNAGWLLHALLLLVLTVLSLFSYAAIATFLSTLGRATAAGVAGTLIWWVLENILTGILTLLGNVSQGFTGTFIKAIPDYFIYNNLNALLENQRQYLLNNGSPPAQITDIHALVVVAVYILLLVSLSCWINRQRDVTN